MKSIILGLKRHPLRFFASIFLAYSALWTVTESIAFFYPDLQLKGLYVHLVFIIASIVIGIIRVYQPRRVSIKVNTSDTTLNIYYGDIFKQVGYIVISVNEFFDSELGDPVSEHSLHGMVIKQYFGGHPESFDSAIQKDLKDQCFEQIERDRGNLKKYPIGTTAKIIANEHKFLLFALSHTNIETFKASSDLSTMLTALHGLFSRSRDCTGGEKLNIPLIGSGISGVGLPATQLLQLIVLAIIDETKKKQICKEINLVIHESRFDEVDLETIKRQWV
ncbi:MAG: DUF6430 domain-containing protein [Gammaproteobacteria bacterium]|nr:DUF6430 domain-containing protein [Gammaproteobacteria bacterium]